MSTLVPIPPVAAPRKLELGPFAREALMFAAVMFAAAAFILVLGADCARWGG